MSTIKSRLILILSLLLLAGNVYDRWRPAAHLSPALAQSFPTRTPTPCPPAPLGPTGTPLLEYLPVIRRQEPTTTPTATAVPPTLTPTATTQPCFNVRQAWRQAGTTPTPATEYLPLLRREAPTVVPTATPAVIPKFNVTIVEIFYDGTGQTEPDEYVAIRNDGSTAVQLLNWTLRDDGGQVFTFPGHSLAPGQTCRVYTDEFHVAWCGFSFDSPTAIWNNDRDCAFLRDSLNAPMDTVCYPTVTPPPNPTPPPQRQPKADAGQGAQ